jgi:hypothetical protein
LSPRCRGKKPKLAAVKVITRHANDQNGGARGKARLVSHPFGDVLTVIPVYRD